MLCDHCVCLCVVCFIGCLVISALLIYFFMWIWYCTYLSSLCVGDLVWLVLSSARVAGWSTTVLFLWYFNISIIRSLRLCCWITTLVVLFCKDGWFSVSVNLRCIVVCVWCDVLCCFVVVGRRILIDIDRYLLCFVIIVFVCLWYFLLVVW